MTHITIGTFSDDVITINQIEHQLPNSPSYIKILCWISPVLIYISNGSLIDFILRQTKVKTALDWMILTDAFLCIFQSVVLIRIGIFGSGSMYPDSTILCVCFTISIYFMNIFNRLLTVGIVIYRYVLQPSIVDTQTQRQTFVQTLFSAIFLTSAAMTGYAAYFRDKYKHHLSKIIRDRAALESSSS